MSIEHSTEEVSPEQIAQSREIDATTKELRQESSSRLQNPSIRKLNERYLLQTDISLHQNPENRSAIQIYHEKLDAMEVLHGLSNRSWFDQFVKDISSQNLTIINQFLEKTVNDVNFGSYIEANGFPVSPLSIELMNREFGLSLSTVTEKKEKTFNAADANIERLTGIYADIWPSLDAGLNSTLLLKKISAWNKEAYIELKALLLEDNSELEALLLAAKKEDQSAGWIESYNTLKYTLLDIDPSFASKITAFEEKYSPDTSLDRAYVNSMSGRDMHIEDGSIISYGEHSETIVLDITKRPPNRSIAIEWSDYFIDANHSLGEIHKPDVEYKAARDELMPQIASASILKTKAIQDHIGDMVDHGYGVGEVKRTLHLCYHIETDYISSIDDLNPSNLEDTIESLTNQLNHALEKYRSDLSDTVAINKEKVREADRQKRNVLKFVKSIWFDVIDKKHTDRLISEIKSNSLHIEGLPLDPSRLDIASGTFGESPSEGGATKWKENMIKFFNKMISGNLHEPISVDAHISVWWKFEDRTKIHHALRQSNVMTSSGSFNYDTARMNLKKSSVSK